jgi:hypothetical protein
VDPGWASFLGQPGAISCHASGVGEWTAGNAGSFAVDLRGGYSYSYSYSVPWEWGEVVRGGWDSSTSTALRAEYEYGRGEPRPDQEGAEHRQTIAHGVSRGLGFTNGEEPRMGRKITKGS